MTLGKMYVIVNEETGKPAIINNVLLRTNDKQKALDAANALNDLQHEAHEEWIVMPQHLVQEHQG